MKPETSHGSQVVGISQRAYARSRRARGLPGGTVRAVQVALQSQRIVSLPDGKLDADDCDRRWDSRATPEALTRRSSRAVMAAAAVIPGSHNDYQRSRARREAAAAEQAELDLAQRRGQLVPAAEITEHQEAVVHSIRDHLLNFPVRCAPEIAAATGGDERAILTILDRLMRSHLEEKATELEHHG